MASVLVVGNGAREHALAWGIARSPKVAAVFVAPVFTAFLDKVKVPEGLPPADDIPGVVQWCQANKIDLVVVGPEQPLANGMTDALTAAGIPCFGPSRAAAQLEASKAFAKEFMVRHNIPTARYAAFTDADAACAHIDAADYAALVVKASGLAAGKGVIVAASKDEAKAAVREMLVDRVFDAAGSIVVIEELLEGPEVSCLAFTDGESVSLCVPAQDHKRLLDNDEGPNTGGMGAFAPCPIMDDKTLQIVREEIIQRAVDGMNKEGSPYHGCIYAGIMLTATGPKTLEFNCRFGDPETQVIIPLIENDLFETLWACCAGTKERLADYPACFAKNKSAVAVVLASPGYPGAIAKGLPIRGLDASHQLGGDDAVIFHAGSAVHDGTLATSGGRVLSVVAVQPSLQGAVTAAYSAVAKVTFDGVQYRRDIAAKGLGRPQGLTYKDAGVDIYAGDELVELIKPLARATARAGCDCDLGGYGGLFDLKAAGYVDPILVSGTDGVGTKLKIAELTDIHNTVGVDLVAMSVNDILTVGAEPLLFLDYVATGHLKPHQLADVIAGIAKGCKDSGCALLGGETAEMPGMYAPGVYDLAGFAVGAVERSQILPRLGDIHEGDVLIGVASSGVHSNGYSLVRRIVEVSGLAYTDPAPFAPDQTLGDALLTPTRLYIKSVLPVVKEGKIKAIAHITGSGIPGNVPRVLPPNLAAVFNAESWRMPPVFKWLAGQGNVQADEAANTFNCGLGLVLVVSASDQAEVLTRIRANGEDAWSVGSLTTLEKTAGQQVVIHNLQKQLDEPAFRLKATPRKRVAVLISGSGSNLQALMDAARKPNYPAEISLVISNVAGVKGLERAAAAGVPSLVIDHKLFATRELFEEAIHQALVQARIDIICLAGFMRILTPHLVDKWRGKILNTHPALLPAFKGAHAHKLALEAGVRISGCTVHFVIPEVDAGGIIAQEAVPVLVGDTEETLQERVKAAEHRIYPDALRLVASEKVAMGPDNKSVWRL